MTDKRELRTHFREIRKAIEPSLERVTVASNHLFGLSIWAEAHAILLYHAVGSELSTDLLLKKANEMGKSVYFPVTLDDQGSMTVGTADLSRLTEGRFGISEPTPLATIPTLDLIVVPGIAFDRFGGRLGQGKGYYDRFLTELSAVTVGFCYSEQLVDSPLPMESHDVHLNWVVTDREVIQCGL